MSLLKERSGAKHPRRSALHARFHPRIAFNLSDFENVGRMIMTKLALAFLAIAAFQPIAYTEDKSDGSRGRPAPQGNKLEVSRAGDEPRSSNAAIQNPNSCAPDRAEPEWGGNGALLGYSCVPPTGNGA